MRYLGSPRKASRGGLAFPLPAVRHEALEELESFLEIRDLLCSLVERRELLAIPRSSFEKRLIGGWLD